MTNDVPIMPIQGSNQALLAWRADMLSFVAAMLLRPKKIVCFRFPTDPIKKCATLIYFMDFPKKKKMFRKVKA